MSVKSENRMLVIAIIVFSIMLLLYTHEKHQHEQYKESADMMYEILTPAQKKALQLEHEERQLEYDDRQQGYDDYR